MNMKPIQELLTTLKTEIIICSLLENDISKFYFVYLPNIGIVNIKSRPINYFDYAKYFKSDILPQLLYFKTNNKFNRMDLTALEIFKTIVSLVLTISDTPLIHMLYPRNKSWAILNLKSDNYKIKFIANLILIGNYAIF